MTRCSEGVVKVIALGRGPGLGCRKVLSCSICIWSIDPVHVTTIELERKES